MIPTRVFRYRDPAAVALGLRELRKRGLTPRGLLFIAQDPRGETYIAVPDDFDVVEKVRIGDKLTLKPPWEGRYFHMDSVHRLPGSSVLWNGDRRLSDTGSAAEVAIAIGEWLKGMSARNVFLGCASHQPGSWWTKGQREDVIDLHARGLVDTIVTPAGLISRKTNDPNLYHLEISSVAKGGPGQGWTTIFKSNLGRILLVERRVANYRLALSCERGIIELDTSGFPDDVRTTATIEMPGGVGVLGRVDAGGFAVTKGRVEEWGLSDVKPATLLGGPNETLLDLPHLLRESDL